MKRERKTSTVAAAVVKGEGGGYGQARITEEDGVHG